MEKYLRLRDPHTTVKSAWKNTHVCELKLDKGTCANLTTPMEWNKIESNRIESNQIKICTLRICELILKKKTSRRREAMNKGKAKGTWKKKNNKSNCDDK